MNPSIPPGDLGNALGLLGVLEFAKDVPKMRAALEELQAQQSVLIALQDETSAERKHLQDETETFERIRGEVVADKANLDKFKERVEGTLRVRERELDTRAQLLDNETTALNQRESEASKREQALEARSKQLDAGDKKLASRTSTLDAREQDLDARERALDAREQALKDRVERAQALFSV